MSSLECAIQWIPTGVDHDGFSKSLFIYSCVCPTSQVEECAQISIVHNMDRVIQLLATVAGGNTCQLASVFMDHVAPHALPNMAVWPAEESLKYSLEW